MWRSRREVSAYHSGPLDIVDHEYIRVAGRNLVTVGTQFVEEVTGKEEESCEAHIALLIAPFYPDWMTFQAFSFLRFSGLLEVDTAREGIDGFYPSVFLIGETDLYEVFKEYKDIQYPQVGFYISVTPLPVTPAARYVQSLLMQIPRG